MTKEIADKGIYSLIIVIGCLINGETPHFHYIADAVSHGLIDISMSYDVPCIFGLLTCDTHEQAKARINNNYAIYGLNYLVQRHLHQETLHEKMEKLMQQAGSVIEDIMDKS